MITGSDLHSRRLTSLHKASIFLSLYDFIIRFYRFVQRLASCFSCFCCFYSLLTYYYYSLNFIYHYLMSLVTSSFVDHHVLTNFLSLHKHTISTIIKLNISKYIQDLHTSSAYNLLINNLLIYYSNLTQSTLKRK